MVAVIVLYVIIVIILREAGVMERGEAGPVQTLPLRAWTWGSIRHFFLSTLEATKDFVIDHLGK